MRIGINVSWMTPGAAGGMEWYVRCLIRQLGLLDQENEYVLVTGPSNHHTFAPPSPRWQLVMYCGQENAPQTFRERPAIALEQRTLYHRLKQVYKRLKGTYVRKWSGKLADLIRRERLDLWFCPFMFALPVDTDVPVVTTIPDLQHEHYPEFFHEHDFALRQLGYQYSCKAATATIAISRHVASEIVQLYDIDPARVFATPLALDPFIEAALPQVERYVARARLKFRLEREYIYFPANGWRHKNHEIVVKAMRRVAQEQPGVQLLLSGCAFDLFDRIRPILAEHDLQDVVRHLGYVTREDVIGLYAASRMLVFPSLFEGFGLPLLEAMHLGAPVACSRIGSLPEVGGDAVVFFDPRSDEDVADAILRILSDEPLRQRLIAAGRQQVARFSYTETARATLEVFQKVRDGELTRPNLPPFRPLVQQRCLDRGLGRWFFRHKDLKELRVEVVQPQKPIATGKQLLEVMLDGQRVLASSIEPQQLCQFVIKAGNFTGSNFHSLELATSNPQFFDLEPLPLRVVSLIAFDSSHRELRLVA